MPDIEKHFANIFGTREKDRQERERERESIFLLSISQEITEIKIKE